jgi:hypothetical protein
MQRLNYRQTTEKCQHVGGQTLSITHLIKTHKFKKNEKGISSGIYCHPIIDSDSLFL